LHRPQLACVAKEADAAIAATFEPAERGGSATAAIEDDTRRETRGESHEPHRNALSTSTRHQHGVDVLTIPDEPQDHLDASAARESQPETAGGVRSRAEAEVSADDLGFAQWEAE
jgi:hypothetical protein